MAAKHARSYHYALLKMLYATRIQLNSTKQQIHTCTQCHLKLIVRWRRSWLLSFTVLTQNCRVPEHQLSSPYKFHSASHANTVNCLKMPKFRCNLRGRKVTATDCTLLVTKSALSSVRYVHFEDSLWSKRSSSPGQSLEVFFLSRIFTFGHGEKEFWQG